MSVLMSSGNSDFARVYDEHLWLVYGFFAYRVRNRELAEDLTQATFERALRYWPKFDPARSAVRTWLMVIAGNLLIDHQRRDRSVPVAEIDGRLLPNVSGPEEQLGLLPELGAALEQLGERDREVIALRFGADLTGPEIAELLELSLANVQQILSRSLRKLRVILEPSGRQ